MVDTELTPAFFSSWMFFHRATSTFLGQKIPGRDLTPGRVGRALGEGIRQLLTGTMVVDWLWGKIRYINDMDMG